MENQMWPRNPSLLEGEEYHLNNKIAQMTALKGYLSVIQTYLGIDPENVKNMFRHIPNAWISFCGVGIDLGGGVGCISSVVATRPEVNNIYCVEMADAAVTICQPLVKQGILGQRHGKVTSVIGDFDQLQVDSGTLDFAFSWDSMHHSRDPIKTFRECRRVLKPNGKFVIVDRAHNNATPDAEIERMLNIQYSEEWLVNNFRPRDQVFTRRQNGEHEHRFREWEMFIKDSGFSLVEALVIKTDTLENRQLKNDYGLPELIVPYEIGAFGQRKVAFVLAST